MRVLCSSAFLRTIKDCSPVPVREVSRSKFRHAKEWLKAESGIGKWNIWGVLERDVYGKPREILIDKRLSNIQKLCTIVHEAGHYHCVRRNCRCTWAVKKERRWRQRDMAERHAHKNAYRMLMKCRLHHVAAYYVKMFGV